MKTLVTQDSANQPPSSSGQHIVRRIIVEMHDDVTPMQALYYCMKVAQGGEVSGPVNRRQHCYHTSFHNGAEVSCVKRGKSERFIVSHKKPNVPALAQSGGEKTTTKESNL